jgi:hypothetical protein
MAGNLGLDRHGSLPVLFWGAMRYDPGERTYPSYILCSRGLPRNSSLPHNCPFWKSPAVQESRFHTPGRRSGKGRERPVGSVMRRLAVSVSTFWTVFEICHNATYATFALRKINRLHAAFVNEAPKASRGPVTPAPHVSPLLALVLIVIDAKFLPDIDFEGSRRFQGDDAKAPFPSRPREQV